MHLLELSEVSEALGWLQENTSETWTANRLLEAACRIGVRLHAVPPLNARYDIWGFESPGGMVKKCGGLGWQMAVLYPIHVAQLQLCKVTETVQVAGDYQEGEHAWFSAPVKVTLDNLRISADALWRIKKRHQEEQQRQEKHRQAKNQVSGSDEDGLDKLFDPVTPAALEKMFPAAGKWKTWCEHAAREGLKNTAKAGRGVFNPYKAGMWFLGKGVEGYDLARIMRVLANNLPERSREHKGRLSGELE